MTPELIKDLQSLLSTAGAGGLVRLSQKDYDYVVKNPDLFRQPFHFAIQEEGSQHTKYMLTAKQKQNLAGQLSSALDTQIGGDHYKAKKIQPIEYCMANNLNACESAIVKYTTRWADKGGVQDLEKIKHYVDLLIELDPRAKSTEFNPARG